MTASGSATISIGLTSAATSLAAGAYSNTVVISNTTSGGTASLQFSLTIAKASPALSWAAPAGIIYGTALSSAQLDAAANVPGAFVYNPASSSVLTVGTKTLSVIFNPSNSTDYNGASTNVNLTVSTTPLTVTASNASRPYGTANPSFTGTISGVVNGDNITATFSCSAASNSPVGNYTITSTLNDPNDRQTNYAVTLNNGALTIVVATPVVTWPAPAPILYGAALGPSQLNASANAAGNFAYTPPPGTVLNNIGTYPLDVVFTPADTTDYKSAEGSVNLTVSPAPLTVTASNASQSYGQPPPVFGGTIVGVTNGDNITAAYSAASDSPPGAYSIVPSLVDPNDRQTNYAVTLNNGTLTVNLVPIALNIQPVNNMVVLTWYDPDSIFALQTAPSLTGVYSNIPGALSPYTNAATNCQQFFQLSAPSP